MTLWQRIRLAWAVLTGRAVVQEDDEPAPPFGFNRSGSAVLPDGIDCGGIGDVRGDRSGYDHVTVKADSDY